MRDVDGRGLRLYFEVGGVTVAVFRLDATDGLADKEPVFANRSSLEVGGRGKELI